MLEFVILIQITVKTWCNKLIVTNTNYISMQDMGNKKFMFDIILTNICRHVPFSFKRGQSNT
jgi:hypothetical protein